MRNILKSLLFIVLLGLSAYSVYGASFYFNGEVTAIDDMLGAPSGANRYERSLIPETDSLYYLGTTTKRWLQVNADEVCIGTDCQTSFPGSGSYLELDQTSPQTIINGIPLLEEDRLITLDHQLVDKRYVDLSVTALGARYYMLDASSTIEQYKTTQTIASEGAEASVTAVDPGDDELIMGWTSPAGGAPTKLVAGVYDWDIFAEKTGAGNKVFRLYWTLVERKSDDSEVVIATSSNSNLIGAKARQAVVLTLSSDYTLESGSTLVGKIYTSLVSGVSAVDIVLYYEGTSDSHWEIPTNIDILNTTFLSRSDWLATTTDGLAEGTTNKYFTDQRVADYINASSSINIDEWDLAYSWGDHSGLYDALGQATSTLASHTTTYNHDNYDTAYSWGDHASAGYLGASDYFATTTHETLSDLPALKRYFTFTISTSTQDYLGNPIVAGATSTVRYIAPYPQTVDYIGYKTSAGTAGINMGDGTNWSGYKSASTSFASSTVSTNNSFIQGESWDFQVNLSGASTVLNINGQLTTD